LPAYFKVGFIVISVALGGCTGISGTIKALPQPPPSGRFLAGASKIDITPPPGYPMGGHSIAGKVGRGFWLRLHARSIFLEDPSGTRMALVSTDLWSMPAGLADRVAELVSRGSSECSIARAGLIIAATHTHQSPGNFSSSPMYNAFASPQPGFDPDLFEFLAQLIAFSIDQACKNKKEAQLFFNSTRLRRIPFARNRSFEAFLNNPEANTILEQNSDLLEGIITPEYPFPQSYRAIDPRLRVLRIKSADSSQADIAIAAFVSVHPTSLTHDAEVYNSDLFGAASIYAENQLSRGAESSQPVVALFNGAEGDISPAWDAQDRRDTLCLGEELANNIMSLEPGQALRGSLNYQFGLRHLAGKCLPESQGRALCTDTEPLEGAAMLGGAEDGRTIFYYLGYHEGIKGHYNEAQGSKKPALDLLLPFPVPDSLTRLIEAATSAPRIIPIGVYSIGSLAIATLPGEFTTVMGQRISRAVRHRMKDHPPDDVLLIGPANEYISYFTTPEEYEEQAYEGASTLYGKISGELVRQKLGLLAERVNNGTPYLQEEIRYLYQPGPIKRFGIKTLGQLGKFPEEGLSPVLQNIETGLPALRTFPAFCWDDRIQDLRSNAGIDFRATPTVAIFAKSMERHEWLPHIIDGIRENDSGLNFLSAVFVVPDRDIAKWCTFWMPSRGLEEQPLSFRFVVETLSGDRIKSPKCVFHHGEVNEECRFKPELIVHLRKK